MSPAAKPFSVRLDERALARLDEGARTRGETKSRAAARLIDEGLRIQAHPGVVFRDGPSGRRAALAGGPDLWEIVETVKGTGFAGEKAIVATAQWGSLTPGQVRVAVRYYAEFRDEIDARIALNHAAAERERAASQQVRDALA